MDNKDIEEKLKCSASKIEMKDFSTRWADISTRINLTSNIKEEVCCEEPVLVTSNGGRFSTFTKLKSPWLIVVSVILLIGIVLGIVLPIVLNKETDRYFSYYELTEKAVSIDEFNNEISNSGFRIVNLSEYDVNSHRLLLSPDNSIVGGSIEFTDEEKGILLTINFHTRFVISEFDIGLTFNEYKTNTANVKYKTIVEDDIYSTVATTTYKDLIYEMEVISLDENLIYLFDSLFN